MNGRICPRCGRPYQTELVHRLRERIDVITDQRDRAIERAERLAKKLKSANAKKYAAQKSRDLWHHRRAR